MLRGEKASKKNGSSRLLDATIAIARERHLIRSSRRKAAIDSTGLESRHVSVYYTRRSNRHKGHLKHRFPKLSALCDTKSHLILSAIVDRGPKLDYAEFKPAVEQALSRHSFETLLADAGYESEAAHVYCREELNLTSIIPTTRRGRKRSDGKPRNLTGHYRKLLHKRFPKKTYGQRWQIETVFSMIKRNLGSALTSRRPYAINREVILRVITHNLMIIRRLLLCFQQSITVFEKHPFARKYKGSDRLQGILDQEVKTICAFLESGRLVVDIPIDLQGLPLPDSPSFIWELTKRPVDYAFGALPALADRIGAPLSRFQQIWQIVRDERNCLGNNVFETYPAASLELLGLQRKGYKGQTVSYCDGKWIQQTDGSVAFARNLQKLNWSGEAGTEITDDDFDAALCAMTGVVDAQCLLMDDELAQEISKRLDRKDANPHQKDAPPPRGYVLLKQIASAASVSLVKKDWSGGWHR